MDRIRNEIIRTKMRVKIGILQEIEQQLSQDSAVGIATGYGLDDRGVGVRVPVG
jgi:hypothetical protein